MSPAHPFSWIFAVTSLWASCFAGCSSPSTTPPPAACVNDVKTDCSLLYDPPIYQTIFDNILHRTCAIGMGSCHTSDVAMGGLVFEDADVAYALLLGQMGARQRVVPTDPACSFLVVRLESTDPNYVMPKGSRLSDEAICDVVQWIAQGAAR